LYKQVVKSDWLLTRHKTNPWERDAAASDSPLPKYMMPHGMLPFAADAALDAAQYQSSVTAASGFRDAGYIRTVTPEYSRRNRARKPLWMVQEERASQEEAQEKEERELGRQRAPTDGDEYSELREWQPLYKGVFTEVPPELRYDSKPQSAYSASSSSSRLSAEELYRNRMSDAALREDGSDLPFDSDSEQ
jgi:hypothetical protein